MTYLQLRPALFYILLRAIPFPPTDPIPLLCQGTSGSVRADVYWAGTYHATTFLTVASSAVLDLVVLDTIRDVRT